MPADSVSSADRPQSVDEAQPADSTAAADAAPAEEPKEKPWNLGVTEEQKARAQPFFDAGNQQFERSQYGNALKEYRKAIELRDHPAIRYNMAVCLIHLDQPLEAHSELVAALRYGADAIGDKAFKEGQTYRKLLLGRLAELQIRTDEAGARVSLNGELLFVGPGSVTRLVLPKRVQIVATKADRLPLTRELVPIPGEHNDVSLEMQPLTDGLVYRRRWARWKPWAVVGGGAALALLGVPLLLSAGDNAQAYDREVAQLCPDGCPGGHSDLPSAVSSLEDNASLEQTLSTSLFVLGGATVITGMALVWLNQPSAVPSEVSPLPVDVQLGAGGAIGRYTMHF